MITLVINDTHEPYSEPRLIRSVLDAAADVGVSQIVHAGDAVSFDAISLKYKADPRDKPRTVKQECERVRTRMFGPLRKQFPKAKIVWLKGNHEERLDKFVIAKCPELRDLGELSVESLVGVKDLEIEVHPYGDLIRIAPHLYATHGDLVRKHSGETARAMSDKTGLSVIHGHTHRLGSYYLTNSRGTIGAWENGCLCKKDPPYIRGVPNWQHGFSLVYSTPSRFHVVQVPITDGRFILDGKLHVVGQEPLKMAA